MRCALALAAVVVFAGCEKHAPSTHDHKHDLQRADAKVKDVVCGMSIDRGTLKVEFDDADFHFCSPSCVEKFKAEPAKYAKACACAKSMKNCACGHCEKKREPCDCGK